MPCRNAPGVTMLMCYPSSTARRGTMTDRPTEVPPQSQPHQPGIETEMHPQPQDQGIGYKAAGKLDGKVAIVTGGDSGIGRAVSVLFAMEGADVAFTYLQEHED